HDNPLTNVATKLTLPSDQDRLRFQTGDVLKIEDEHVLVLGYEAGTGELEIQRGFQSTTPAQHAQGTPVVGLGSALPEGSDPKEVRALDRVDRYNYTQIFGPVEVKTSGTRQVTARYGAPAGSEFAHQAANRIAEQWVAREYALLYGTRWQDTATERRTMGGMAYYMTANVDDSTNNLDFGAIRDQLQAIYEAGGRADTLLCSVPAKPVIDDFNDEEVRYTRVDNGRGMIVDVLYTSFGTLTVIMSRWVQPSDLFIYNRANLKIRPLRPMQFVPLDKTGDSTRGMVVSETSFELQGPRHAARFS